MKVEHTAADGGSWPAESGTQQDLLVRRLLQLEKRTGIPADELIDVWSEAAGVDRERLHSALHGRTRLTPREVNEYQAAAKRLAPGAAPASGGGNMTIRSPNEWDYRKLIAVAALLVFVVLALIWWAWQRARKVPVCHKQDWWPKKALGKKALDAGREVFEYYQSEEGLKDEGPGFGDLPAFSYWSQVTGRSKLEWIYSQAVLQYLGQGDVTVPANLPPCVFDPKADCPACVEIKILWEEAQALAPKMGA